MLIAHSVLWLCAELGPLALFVDDAQWADQPSLDVLAYLARRIDDLPLLLVVASRTALPLRSATVLRPQPLTPAGSARLIRRSQPVRDRTTSARRSTPRPRGTRGCSTGGESTTCAGGSRS